ncbi:MAG: hypothetical protein M1823_002281 [Watsoniomyces obsoletus]|nr:MAG: hypothetical protein M1823_002281 [Watsoniomyces obsoletus]
MTVFRSLRLSRRNQHHQYCSRSIASITIGSRALLESHCASQCRGVHLTPHERPTFGASDTSLGDARRLKSKRAVRRWDPQKWELTVGIEIHAQLYTKRKLFSTAATSISEAANTHVSVFDAALPGTQPHFQAEALIPSLRAALALGCDIQRKSRFDRKHYFYRDQPAGYQITQYYEPFARNGKVVLHDYDGIAAEDGECTTIDIKHVQLEQDTAKSMEHTEWIFLLDFNRVSSPLIEIVSLPQIHHPATAAAYVKKIQWILKCVSASTLGMELGGLRADVNVSVRRRPNMDERAAGNGLDTSTLGRRTEIKNLSSFKAVEDAIKAERDRQVAVLEAGGVVEGETRGWALGGTETTKLRAKEGEVDYRYLPDPDLPPLIISEDLIDHITSTLPILPDEQMRLLTAPDDYNLTKKDARTLLVLDDGERLEYYQEVRRKVQDQLDKLPSNAVSSAKVGRTVGNWVLHELGGLLATSEQAWSQNKVSASTLAEIVTLLLKGEITGGTAKSLLGLAVQGDVRSVMQIVEEQNLLLRPMSDPEYLELARAVISEHQSIVQQIQKTRKASKINFLVGQMIRRGERGRVEAPWAETTLRQLLEL